MAKQITGVDKPLYQYMLNSSLREADILHRLREETNRLTDVAAMQISPDQGQFMAMLVKLLSAHSVLEIGCFTGYSALAMALAMNEAKIHGRIVTCDISEQWTALARGYWREANMDHIIELRLGRADESLQRMVENGDNQFDLAFIDADKTSLKIYYEYCLRLLKPGGLILIDNVFWGGDILDKSKNDPDTVAIREFNRFLHEDQRVDVAMLAIGDGLSLARIRQK